MGVQTINIYSEPEEKQWEGIKPRGEEVWKRKGMKRDVEA